MQSDQGYKQVASNSTNIYWRQDSSGMRWGNCLNIDTDVIRLDESSDLELKL